MGQNDWAIVVGVQSYFDDKFNGLKGPENDATVFYEWVISPSGGAVPATDEVRQATKILSSDFSPPFTNAAAAMPTAQAIKVAFDHLYEIADENAEKGIGREVGDRLYLFFAGHGFAPTHRDDQVALLMADASSADSQLSHVLGPYMADIVWRAKFFKEIFLFMDCCRVVEDCAQLFTPYAEERATDYHTVKRFYAYGARVDTVSREWTPPGRTCHGVFTMTLMEALGGTAADPNDPKNITAWSLYDQLYHGFKANMAPDARERPDLPKEPEVYFERKPNSNFVIAPVPPKSWTERLFGPKKPRYPVSLRYAPALAGKRLVIRSSKLEDVDEITLGSPPGTLTLERGLYVAVVPDENLEATFEVTGGVGAVDVRL